MESSEGITVNNKQVENTRNNRYYVQYIDKKVS